MRKAHQGSLLKAVCKGLPSGFKKIIPSLFNKKFVKKLATMVHKVWIQDILNFELASIICRRQKERRSIPRWTRYKTNGRFQLLHIKYIMHLPIVRKLKMERNRINLFNDPKRTDIAGGKLVREVCGKLQMIGGQPSIWVHSKSNLTMTSLGVFYHISCWLSHSRSYQLQSRLHICYMISNTLNRPISYGMHCIF